MPAAGGHRAESDLERSSILSPKAGNPAMTDIVPGLPAPPAEFAFLLDIDGTILDIAATPAQVRVPNSLRETLARLARLSGEAPALRCGRSLPGIGPGLSPL